MIMTTSLSRRIWLRTPVLLLAAALAGAAAADDRSIVLATTTTTEGSGLLARLLPAFKQASGIDVKVVATGTAQALDMARKDAADVVLVHDKIDEDRFLAEGHSLKRQEVMYNDFVLVGPTDDPAGAKGRDIAAALGKLAASKAAFVSRADKSGTHAAELRFWKAAGVEAPASRGELYKECNCTMGKALAAAAAANAYTLADRGSWLGLKDRAGLAILVEGDSRLFNPYAVMVVNPEKHPKVKREAAQAFADWLVSPAGQAVISDHRIGGEPLFVASAAK
jgi:tungstate transport system substrate-binding protein